MPPVHRFRHDDLDLSEEKIEDRFVTFAGDLLGREGETYPYLRSNRQGGADGGFDLSYSVGNGLGAIDCKCLGADDVNTVLAEWRKLAERLTRNLTDDRPQASQYSVWYTGSTRPVQAFTLCVSAHLQREKHRDDVVAEMRAVFREIGKRRGLEHLASMPVAVLEWGGLDVILSRNPGVAVKWFKAARPDGLIPLAEAEKRALKAPFARFLYRHRFYSPLEYAQQVGTAGRGEAADPQTLVELLPRVESGLIITGIGGIGKTRLMIEVGKRAEQEGWTTVKASELGDGTWAAAHHRMAGGRDEKLLILVDYAEEQQHFIRLAQRIQAEGDDGAMIRVVANCRNDSYPRFSTVPGLWRVALSRDDPAEARWWDGYRQWVVRRILEDAIEGRDIERHVAQCSGLPVLAVFMAFLAASGRATELDALLAERSFTAWLAKRVALHFNGDARIDRHFALLMALLPSSLREVRRQDHFRQLRDWLVRDGWIAETDGPDGSKIYESIHDVVVDQLLLEHTSGLDQGAVEDFAEDLFDLAQHDEHGLQAALRSLGRVAKQPVFKRVAWSAVLGRRVASGGETWAKARPALLAGGLLDPGAAIDLFRAQPKLLAGSPQTEPLFQRALGDLARNTVKCTDPLEEAGFDWLINQLEACLPHLGEDDYLLTSGIKILPSHFAGPALDWLHTQPLGFGTHFLLVAWLEAGQPLSPVESLSFEWCSRFRHRRQFSFLLGALADAKADIRPLESALRHWLNGHRLTLEAQFVYHAWLDAGGGVDAVGADIRDWLDMHRLTPEARFVYDAWLDAKGGVEAVRADIRDWLDVHRFTPEARFVYDAWLDANGGVDAVGADVRDWLDKHRLSPEASHVYEAWLDANGGVEAVRADVREWLDVHRLFPEASHVYKAWLDAKGGVEAVRADVRDWLDVHRLSPEARFVYDAWLDANGGVEAVAADVRDWLDVHRLSPEAQFVYDAWLDADGGIDAVGADIRDWLGVHGACFEADHVYRAWIKARGDFAAVACQVFQWLAGHRENREAKFLLREILKQKELPRPVIEDAIHWVFTFPDDPETPQRLRLLMPHMVAAGWAGVASRLVVRCWGVQSGIDPSDEGRQGWLWLILRLATGRYESEFVRAIVDAVIVGWLRHEGYVGPATPIVERSRFVSLGIRVFDLVERAMLCPKRDRDALLRFVAWWDRLPQSDAKECREGEAAVRQLARLL